MPIDNLSLYPLWPRTTSETKDQRPPVGDFSPDSLGHSAALTSPPRLKFAKSRAFNPWHARCFPVSLDDGLPVLANDERGTPWRLAEKR